jgi:hypothetical protein
MKAAASTTEQHKPEELQTILGHERTRRNKRQQQQQQPAPQPQLQSKQTLISY